MTSIYNSTTTTLLVDTTSTRKIVFLPVASTVGAGRLLWIKDISGNAAVSSIFISTIGMDRIENRFAPSTLFAVMSTSYGSVMMTTDGILNWYFLQHYYRNAVSLGATGGSATGGTVTQPTISGTSYTIHTFTTVGTTTFTVSGSIACDYLVVAGGGGGGTGRGGGGGGGGVLQGSMTLTTGSYTITVGDRGNQSINDLQGGDGGSSSIAALVVTTGGGGGGGWITNAGRNGGSGGGASAGSAASGGTGVAGQGFAGSARLDGNTGGGGGGAGGAASGSTGAIGVTSMITGTTTYYAGGGGAGGVSGGGIGVALGGTYQVANGTYGGGNGANTPGTNQPFQNAVANTGGGGGGQEGYTGYSGFGGTGIVIIRYLTSPPSGRTYSFTGYTNSPGNPISYINSSSVTNGATTFSGSAGASETNVFYSYTNDIAAPVAKGVTKNASRDTINLPANTTGTQTTFLSYGPYNTSYTLAGSMPTGFSASAHTVIMIMYHLGTTGALGGSSGQGKNNSVAAGGIMYQMGRSSIAGNFAINGQLIVGENGAWDYNGNYSMSINATTVNIQSKVGWVMVAFVWRAGNTCAYYYNGSTAMSSGGGNGASAVAGTIYIGVDQRATYYNGVPGSCLNAEIAFYGLWNSALTATQIGAFYTQHAAQFSGGFV